MAQPGRPASRRKKRTDEPPPRIKWRSIAIQLAVVLVIVLLFVLVNRNGGAPQSGGAPAGVQRAEIVAWTIFAAGPEGTNETLCRSAGTCTVDDLWPAVRAGADCTAEVTVWLGSGDHPLWASRINASYNATVLRGDLSRDDDGRVNTTSSWYEGDVDWTEGTWFRVERATVDLVIHPVPCDPWQITVRLDADGRTWTGGPFRTRQQATAFIHDDIAQAGGAPGGAAPV